LAFCPSSLRIIKLEVIFASAKPEIPTICAAS
jgi:hypothetical protein